MSISIATLGMFNTIGSSSSENVGGATYHSSIVVEEKKRPNVEIIKITPDSSSISMEGKITVSIKGEKYDD